MLIGYGILLATVLLICGMAMHITGRDNQCTEQGGHLEFSARSWDGADCIMP